MIRHRSLIARRSQGIASQPAGKRRGVLTLELMLA
jgi:hypothetical protein